MGVKTSLNADTLKRRTDLMKKPKILLSGKLKAENYLDAVILSGGEGVFEYIPQNFKGYDGLILCGGNDVDPCFYGEEDNGSVNAHAPLTVVNTRGFDLPETGDNGTMMFTVIGILAMAGAAAVIVLVSRKKRTAC